MKNFWLSILFMVLLLTLAAPQVALAQGGSGDRYVIGGAYTLTEGETLDGNLIVLGGVATLEKDSRIAGDIFLAGGTVQVGGEVEGDVFAAAGSVSLMETALVKGDITTIAAQLDRAEGARIEGRINTGSRIPLNVTIPGGTRLPVVRVQFNPFWDGVKLLFGSFIWAALAVLVVMFLPRHTERVRQTVVSQPLVMGGVGLLTVVTVPLVLVVMAITLILIPVTLLGALLLVVTWGFGLIVIGTEVGKRLAKALKQDWPLALTAGVGTFALTLVVNGTSRVVPCVGWLAPFLVGIIGVGAVLLTRYGTQVYPLMEATPLTVVSNQVLPAAPAAAETQSTPPASPGPAAPANGEENQGEG